MLWEVRVKVRETVERTKTYCVAAKSSDEAAEQAVNRHRRRLHAVDERAVTEEHEAEACVCPWISRAGDSA